VFNMIEARGTRRYPRIGVSFVVQEDNVHERDRFLNYWIKIADCVRIAELHQRGDDINHPILPRKPCTMLYRNMYIHHNGDVSVCCWDAYGHTNLGNVFRDGIAGAWNGPGFTATRHAHESGDVIPFCAACQDWPRYMYTSEEVVKDILVRKTPLMTYYNRIDRIETWRR